jgi:hypothetical protein
MPCEVRIIVAEHATSSAATSPAPGRSRSPMRATETTVHRSNARQSNRAAITIVVGSSWNWRWKSAGRS